MGKLRKSILIAMFIAFVVGAILFIYPFFRGFFLDWRMKDSAGSFLEQMEAPDTSFSMPENPDIREESLPTEETIPNEALWIAVHDYNQQIWEERQSELTDPWAYQQPSFTLEDFGMEDEIFGVISIPEIELEMPIYLGATADRLSLGAAQLSQTSIPVGGNSTNCVLAGHRGWRGGKYFSNIVSLKKGDEVFITNLWETLSYRVVRTEVIESYEVDKIKIQPDKDMLTLLTCYYRSKTHKMRFVVYCERVEGGVNP